MGAVPVPCAGDDGRQVGELGLPIEFGHGLGAVGVEGRRVAGAALADGVGDFEAGDLLDGADDVEDAGGLTGAEVVEEALAAGGEFVKDGDMGSGEVIDMDVVAQAGAVGGGVIVAEDGEFGAQALGGPNGQRDQMGLGVMCLADAAVGGGTCGIEVAEGCRTEAIGAGAGLEHDFKVELGLAVGIDGGLGQLLGHRHGFGNAVGSAGGGEDKFVDAAIAHGQQQLDGFADVVFVVFEGIGNGFADVGEGGEMHYQLDLLGAQDGGDLVAVAEILFIERDMFCHGLPVAEDKVIENDRSVPGCFQFAHAMAANVARSSNYQYIHADEANACAAMCKANSKKY